MIRTLPRAIAAFDRQHPQLRSAEGAAGACCLASGLFCAAVPGAREAHLWGSRRYFPRRVDEYPAKDPGFYHCVVVIGGLAIDWTRRQLDPRAAHPFIQPATELRRDWIRVGPSPEYLGL
jgi:hypothetical protein